MPVDSRKYNEEMVSWNLDLLLDCRFSHFLLHQTKQNKQKQNTQHSLTKPGFHP